MAGIDSETFSVGVTIDEANMAFTKDGTLVTVKEDTVDPTNNIAMPVGNFIYKDGIQVPITKDTLDPNGTIGMPVEIVAVDGTEINITAGDINVQTSHAGVSYDSMRVGDGINLLQINANLQAEVHDTDLNTAIGTQADATEEDNTVDASMIAYIRGALAKLETIEASNSAIEASNSAIEASIARLAQIDSFYYDGVAETTGNTIGTTAGNIKKINVHSQIGQPMSVSIGGTVVAVLLAGGGGDYDCSGLTGAVVITSLTTNTSGKIAINLMG